jgi:Tfp pilus assembly protein PilO
MQQHRIISLASILVMLLIPVIGWFLVAQPQLAAASAADQQRVAMEAQIAASSAIVAKLKEDSANLPELNDDLDELRTSIPAGVDPSGYIDGLDALARLNHVSITSLTVADPMAYTPATPPVDPNAAPADAPAEGDGTTEPVAPVVTDPAIFTSPLINGGNFVAIPVTIEISGEWGPVLSFIDGLQSTDRLFLVTALDTAHAEPGSATITAKITGFIWAIPTGVEGHPRPTSTTVKQLTAIAPPVVEPDPVTDGEPDPEPTEDPAP